jgi:hypothetical protein
MMYPACTSCRWRRNGCEWRTVHRARRGAVILGRGGDAAQRGSEAAVCGEVTGKFAASHLSDAAVCGGHNRRTRRVQNVTPACLQHDAVVPLWTRQGIGAMSTQGILYHPNVCLIFPDVYRLCLQHNSSWPRHEPSDSSWATPVVALEHSCTRIKTISKSNALHRWHGSR